MKKLFYVFVALIAMSMFSCGNKPEEKKVDEKAIEIKADVHDIVVNLSVTPKLATTPYIMEIFEKSELSGIATEALGDSIVTWVNQTLEFYKAIYEAYEMEFDLTFEDFTFVGPQKDETGMEPNTEFVVVAFYVDVEKAQVLADSKIYTAEFTTGDMPKSDLKISLAYNEETQCVDVTVSDEKTPYYIALFSKEYYTSYASQMTDGEILADDLLSLIDYYEETTPEDWMFTGSGPYDFVADYGSVEDGAYVMLAGTYYYGYINSDVAKVEFDFVNGEEAGVKAYQAPVVKRIIRDQMPIRFKGIKH